MSPTLEQLISELVQARSTALVQGDIPTLERLLHPDFVYVNAWGEVRDRASYLSRFADPANGPKWERQEVSEVSVRVYSDCAVVTCRVHDVATWGDNKLDAEFRSTFVYVNTRSGWRCVQGHTSSIEGA